MAEEYWDDDVDGKEFGLCEKNWDDMLSPDSRAEKLLNQYEVAAAGDIVLRAFEPVFDDDSDDPEGNSPLEHGYENQEPWCGSRDENPYDRQVNQESGRGGEEEQTYNDRAPKCVMVDLKRFTVTEGSLYAIVEDMICMVEILGKAFTMVLETMPTTMVETSTTTTTTMPMTTTETSPEPVFSIQRPQIAD